MTLPWDTWTAPALAGDLRAAFLGYITAYDYVSFPELTDALSPLCAIRGTRAVTLEIPDRGSLVLWVGWSEQAVEALSELVVSGKVVAHPSSPLVYLLDGGLLRYPLAKRPPRGGYKTPHWWPVTFRAAGRRGAARSRGALVSAPHLR